MEKKHQINLWYAFIAMMLVLMFQSWWTTYKTVEQIPYSQFEQYLKDGKIEEIAVKENFIEGKFKAELKDGKQYFVTTRVEVPLADELSKYDVKYTGVVQNTFIRDILSWVLPVLLLFGLWMFFIRRFAEKQGLGGMMTVGKSKAKVFVEKDVKVTFQNVAGVDEAKRELKEIVDFLKEPASYGRLGAHVPKGILLVGPPAQARRFWRAPWPVKPVCRSSRSPAPNSWRCSSASAPREFETSSSRPERPPLPSSSSTSWTHLAGHVHSARWAPMTRRNRRSTSF